MRGDLSQRSAAIRSESADEYGFSGNTEQMDGGIFVKCKNNLSASCGAEHMERVCAKSTK